MPYEPRMVRLVPNGPPDKGLTPLELDQADFQSPLPEQHWHVFFEDDEIGLTVGVWDTTTMQETFGPYPGDEFVSILEGDFAMVDGTGNATRTGIGDCVAFRNGAPMSWKQQGYLKKFFITLLSPNAETPQIDTADGAVIIVDPDTPLKASSKPGEPIEREHISFRNDTGNMTVGVWECENAEFEMEPFSVHEYVQVIDGEATITEAAGTTHNVRAGDCFFIPKGTLCKWSIPTHIKKYYAQVAT
ncbi:cupin domain-containing protein [Falsiruegeria litorea]|uniref:cupin domain-containing protein n=1 Tax=Falsiruegeria litorea TaxID=1280831 RepID=UPI001BFDFDD7|nr:cupin domain-containing protein [Falsiruegeria litorea]MBT8169562.1 DUF861 domain-containing protein [Falsiruegeria litorea]